jgi:general secretion pathway protein C
MAFQGWNRIKDALARAAGKRPRIGMPLPNFKSTSFPRSRFFYTAIATVVCAYFAADFASVALKKFLPEPPTETQRQTTPTKTPAMYDLIAGRNLFNEKGLIPNTEDPNAGFDGPPVKTSLPLNLTGIIMVQDELKSVASIEDKSKNQVVAVRISDPIKPDVIVQKIEADRVIFLNRPMGRREYVELPKELQTKGPHLAPGPSAGAGINKTSDTTFQIDRTEVDKTLGNLNEVLTQARCVPNFENGRPSGYRCFQIVKGSIYDKLGMQDGDVICGINGESVNDPAKAFSLLTELKTSNGVELCINRNGRVMNMNYNIH